VECREGWCWTLTEDGIVSFGEAQGVVCAAHNANETIGGLFEGCWSRGHGCEDSSKRLSSIEVVSRDVSTERWMKVLQQEIDGDNGVDNTSKVLVVVCFYSQSHTL
jgi:hypothetical protein